MQGLEIPQALYPDSEPEGNGDGKNSSSGWKHGTESNCKREQNKKLIDRTSMGVKRMLMKIHTRFLPRTINRKKLLLCDIYFPKTIDKRYLINWGEKGIFVQLNMKIAQTQRHIDRKNDT